jgi:hypothetical protein
MKKFYFFSTMALSVAIMVVACGKSSTPAPADPCTTTNLSVSANTTASSSCTNTGGITVMASGGTGLQYQLDAGSFVTTSSFTAVAAGAHTVTVKNTEGCTKSTMVTVANTGSSGITINETLTESNPCFAAGLGDGAVSINATNAAGGALEYKLDAGNFQPSSSFTGVSAGMHVITVKNAAGCTQTKNINIGTKVAGTMFNAVKSLLQSKCGGCHSNGGQSGGFNFDDDCQIVVKKDRINQRAVITGDMPQGGPQLTNSQKATITAWLAAGGQKGN